MKKGDRIEFENGRDMLRGVVVGKHVDAGRPDMEETWTVFADSVLKRTDTGKRTAGEPLARHDGAPVLDSKGKQKLGAGEPIYTDEWIRVVDEDGVQACDKDGLALYKNFGGDPLQLVKHGVPVPFRVRARRAKIV